MRLYQSSPAAGTPDHGVVPTTFTSAIRPRVTVEYELKASGQSTQTSFTVTLQAYRSSATGTGSPPSEASTVPLPIITREI